MNKIVRSSLAAVLRPRTPKVPLALSVAVAAVLFTPQALSQINFTIPDDAPDGGIGFIGVLEVTGNGNQDNQNTARNSLLIGGTRLTGTASTINFYNSDGRGNFQNDFAFLSDTTPNNLGTDDIGNIATLYRGIVNIPTAGDYTFGVNSDDGFTLAFDNGTSPFSSTVNGGNGATLETFNGTPNGAFQFFGGRGTSNSLAVVNLPAGDHPFILSFHEGTGGSAVELFAATGAQSGFNSSFNLLGGSAFTTPGRALGTVGTWDYVTINGVGGPNNGLDETITRYNNNAPTGSFIRTAEPTIDFSDPQGAGSGGRPSRPFPNDTPADDNGFGGVGRVSLTIAPGQEGRYTFDVFSDDSFRFRIFDTDGVGLVPLVSTNGGNAGPADTNGDSVNDAFTNPGSCCGDALGRYDLSNAGTYTLEAIFAEGGGGAGFLVYGAQGDFGGYDPTIFQLVGAPNQGPQSTPAGLALVPEPTSAVLCVFGSLLALGVRRRK